MTENKNLNNFNQQDETALQLMDSWHMVWDHKWWYVVSVAFCLAVAVFYLYREPSIYSRTAKVIIDEGAQEAAMRDLSAFMGASSRRYSTNVDNEVEAISSPDLMEEVVIRLGLETSYHEHQLLRKVELGDNSPVKMSLAGENPLSSFSFQLDRLSESAYSLSNFMVKGEKIDASPVKGHVCDTISTPVGRVVITPVLSNREWSKPITISWRNSKSAAKAFAAATKVSISSKQTSVVVLTINDKFPSRAENILNTLMDVYDESWIFNKNRSARLTTQFINDRLVVIEQELGGIESELKNYKENQKVTDVKAVGSAYLQESTNFETRAFEVANQLSIARFIRDYLNNPAHSLSPLPSNSGITSSNVESQIVKYNELLFERDRMLSTSSESNPLIADCNNTLASMRSAILRSIDNLIVTLELQAAQIKDQEDLILKKIASATGQEFEILSIERQQKVKESLYIYLLQKREENEIASLVNVANTRLIMAPNGSPSPVEPRSMMVLLIAIVLGCAIPFGVVFLIKTLDTTVAFKDDVTSVVSLPFLGELPSIGKKKRFSRLRYRRKDFRNDANRKIVVVHGRRNAINEAFRVLRTNLDMMLASQSGCKVVMVSSYYPGSGKTFISLNISSSMAIKGNKVLLIDLDLRKASLSEALGTTDSGISSYLSGQEDKIAIEHINENLDVIKSGKLPPNPTELLLSEKFRSLIEEFRHQYDYIFLDCPPAEIVADSAIIASSVDLTIFVIRSGLMDKRNLPLVNELYESGKYKRMAVVLNAVPVVVSKYGYSYGKYGYGSGYGYTYGDVYGHSDSED